MGFYLEKYNENRAGLVVTFQGGDTNTATYFSGDSVQEAMEYFDVYLNDTLGLCFRTEDSKIVEEIGVDSTTIEEFQEKMAVLTGMLSDDQAKDNVILFRNWKTGKLYKKDDRIRYEGDLYKCLQDHTSQSDWTPSAAPSLWAVLYIDPSKVDENGEVVPQEWHKTDSTNPYMTGDKVIFNEDVYESLIDNNSWSPAEYPAGWKKIVSEDSSSDTDSDSGNDSSSSSDQGSSPYPEWKQPDANNPYKNGDVVTYNGKNYKSNIDNNVWSPDAYPAGWTQI